MVGSIGWCFGGGQSLQLSLNEPLDATVIYYGNLVSDKSQLKKLKGPVLGIFGSIDTNVTVSSVNEFKAALKSLGKENSIHIYEGVGHAFANPTGATYAEKETADAWKKTLRFFEENLRAVAA
jgi:carboxymethylenebutenolidase